MARRKKQDDGGGCLGMIGALILAVCLAVFWGAAVAVAVAPLVFGGMIWYYRGRLQELEPLPEDTGDLWLDEHEKARFAELHEILEQTQQEAEIVLTQARQEAAAAHTRAQQEEEAAQARVQQEVREAQMRGEQLGLAVNKDGSFNRRSRAGKEIAATLEQAPERLDAARRQSREKKERASAKLAAVQEQVSDTIRRYQSEYDALAAQPRQWWTGIKTVFVRLGAAKMALLAYCTLGLLLSFGYHFFWGSNLVRELLIGSGLVSIVAYLFGTRLYGETFEEHLPAPPRVDMENLERF